ncbi:MAG: LysR family transcriptional regulator [Peptococcaceae bacterium]|nr:LysR family transcriptional regulator [Peptococcaceae bacterium]
MNLRNLECFIAVAQYLNFTKAAQHLYIAQSAVSHNIAELEKEINVKLFIRNKQSITLTGAGEVFLEEALKITSLVREAVTKTQKLSSGLSGKLSVGYIFVPIINCMISRFKTFFEKYPNIDVYYNSYDSITMSRLLDNNELDIGFARLITISNRDKKYWQPLYRDPLYIVAPIHHHLANEPKINLKMISNEPLILMKRKVNPGMFDSVNQLCMSNGFTPKIIEYANDIMTQIMMAQIGKGLIIMPGCFKSYVPDDLRFIPIDDETAYHEIGVVWNKQNANPAVELFLKEIGVLM